MKFTLCIVALTFMVSVEAVPAPASTPITLPAQPEPDFFDNKLKSVQEAILDTLKAGQDLQLMEGALQRIVNLSSYFYRTESATEYAVDKKAYANGWAVEDIPCEQDSDCESNSCTSSGPGMPKFCVPMPIRCEQNSDCESNVCIPGGPNMPKVCVRMSDIHMFNPGM